MFAWGHGGRAAYNWCWGALETHAVETCFFMFSLIWTDTQGGRKFIKSYSSRSWTFAEGHQHVHVLTWQTSTPFWSYRFLDGACQDANEAASKEAAEGDPQEAPQGDVPNQDLLFILQRFALVKFKTWLRPRLLHNFKLLIKWLFSQLLPNF